MPRPCSTCKSERRPEIERRIREGRSYLDIERWLREVGEPISNAALAKHAKESMGVIPQRGARPQRKLREAIIADVEERLAAGEIQPTIRDALTAQRDLDAVAAKGADRDLALRIAQILGGATALPQPSVPLLHDGTVIDGKYVEIEEDEALFEKLAG